MGVVKMGPGERTLQNMGESEMKQPGLQLMGISKSFGKKEILSPATVTFAPGLHLIRGANGSGKSTLLRMLGGLLPPTDGDAVVGGLSLRRDPLPYRRLVNHAGSEGGLPLAISARDLFAFGAAQKGDTLDQALSIAHRLGLGHAVGERLAVYSSGMLKKTALILSLLGPGRVVLWDEPFNALDDGAVAALAELGGGVVGAGGCLLVATHGVPLPWAPLAEGAGKWRVQDGNLIPGS